MLLVANSFGYAKSNKLINKFAWPVKGKIISYYGDIVDNIVNKGIDIYVSAETPVIAANSGKIKFCRELKGYGKTIIIDHKYGWSSVYSNLNIIYTKEGKYVKKNSTIGKTNSNSYLHFEIRKDGISQNPLKYLN